MREFVKKCKYCGKTFTTTSKIRMCCSDVCSHKSSALTTKQRGKNFKRQYKLNDNFLDIDSNIKYYFLGLMASDGCLNELNHTISISQSGDNGLKLIEYIKKILDTNYPIYITNPKVGKQVYSLSFRSQKIWQKLIENNIKPRKTYNFHIPEYILNDLNKLKYFFIGYIDGDGCIGVYKNMLSISFVCSFNMQKQLEKISIFQNAKFCKKNNVIDIRFNGIKALRFCDFLYKNISVYKSYKYNKYIEYKKVMFDISPKMKYNFIQEELFKAFEENPNLNCMQYAKEHNINFQYVYYNREKWRKQYDK